MTSQEPLGICDLPTPMLSSALFLGTQFEVKGSWEQGQREEWELG